MFSTEKHLDNLLRHKELIKDAAILIGKRLIEQGRPELGRAVISRGFAHDNSKFFGIEWQYLHNGPDVEPDDIKQAIKHHHTLNRHHPEFYENGIVDMSEEDIYEMACDFYARAEEFGTDLRSWINTTAKEKFAVTDNSPQFIWLNTAIDLLLEKSFVDI